MVEGIEGVVVDWVVRDGDEGAGGGARDGDTDLRSLLKVGIPAETCELWGHRTWVKLSHLKYSAIFDALR